MISWSFMRTECRYFSYRRYAAGMHNPRTVWGISGRGRTGIGGEKCMTATAPPQAPKANALVAAELEAWMRLGLSLVEVISAHPVITDGCDVEAFRAKLAEATNGLKDRPVSKQILIAS